MAGLHEDVQREQGTAQPFIFLSDVLMRYGSFSVRLNGEHDDGDTVVGSKQSDKVAFCCFLASKIKESEILLFDVHNLKLISGLELREVISFLLNPGKEAITRNAIKNGRDYCLDGETAIRAINEIRKSGVKYAEEAGSSKEFDQKYLTLVRNSDPCKNQIVDDWSDGGEQPFSLEQLQLKVAEGRLAAKSESMWATHIRKYPKSPAGRHQETELLPGATAQSEPHDWSDWYVHFIGKFNRVGFPALWFDTTKLKWPVLGSETALRNEMLNTRLKEMYELSGKPKTDLCKDLADQLAKVKGPYGKTKNISAATIYKITGNPGGRKAGGSKPKSQRQTK